MGIYLRNFIRIFSFTSINFRNFCTQSKEASITFGGHLSSLTAIGMNEEIIEAIDFIAVPVRKNKRFHIYQT